MIKFETFTKQYKTADLVRQPNEPAHWERYGLWSRKDAEMSFDAMKAEIQIQFNDKTKMWEGTVLMQNFNAKADHSVISCIRKTKADILLLVQIELAKII